MLAHSNRQLTRFESEAAITVLNSMSPDTGAFDVMDDDGDCKLA